MALMSPSLIPGRACRITSSCAVAVMRTASRTACSRVGRGEGAGPGVAWPPQADPSEASRSAAATARSFRARIPLQAVPSPCVSEGLDPR